eukprot:TRINITY_DN17817_c0_g1_i1.p1 TRINITY_DN17817_c0_g1~~TRINITY_DN17817_c0_g1_i1.p1  ORF type:complete len:547 (+),score=149.69 TRINITY_DN17817_c0_g1_i1:162-1802(+)
MAEATSSEIAMKEAGAGQEETEPHQVVQEENAPLPPEEAIEQPMEATEQPEEAAEQPAEAGEVPKYREMGTMTSDFEELAGMVFVPAPKPDAQENGGEESMLTEGEAEPVEGEQKDEEPVRKVSLYVEAVPPAAELEGGRQLALAENGAPADAVEATEEVAAVNERAEVQEVRTGSSADGKKRGGLRCEVCKRVKKAGCGTDNAHPRCERHPNNLPAVAQLDVEHVMKLSATDEDERVSLWCPATGARLSGMAAPMLRNLPAWLTAHPGWEPVEKPPEGTPARKRKRAPAVAPDNLLAVADSEGSEHPSPMANPPQTPNPTGSPPASGTPGQAKPYTPSRLGTETPMTEEERERQAEARRVRKELGPRCEVCQVIKKAGCGTEDANPRCLRHPRRGEAGLLEAAASPPQVPAEKRSVEKKPLFKYEGGRCEVCTTIKKGGCGTESAHRRCLKNPRGPQSSMSPLKVLPGNENDDNQENEGEHVPMLIEQQRVTLWHPDKKQKLCGMAAPMLKNLENYLKMHPGWVPIQKIDEAVTASPAEEVIEAE